MDDHWFLQRLRDGTGGTMDLFVFITPETPRDGWNLAPELKLAFWRPLAALTHQLDYALTDSVVAWHVHSWLWLLAAVAAGTALYRQVSPGWTGLLAAVMFGCPGAVGTNYNFAAPHFYRMIENFHTGNVAEAVQGQREAVRLIRVCQEYGFLPAAKAIMSFLGIDCGPTRAPIRPLTETQIADLCRLGPWALDFTTTGMWGRDVQT